MYRVLLVEDDKTNLFLYRKMQEWKQMGFEIAGEAKNGKEALQKIETEDFDLILVDVMMPVMNGLELLQELQERQITIPSIIASTYNEFEYVRQGMRLGAMDYLLKPVSKEELLQCLKRVREKLSEKEEDTIIEEIFKECGADVSAGFVQKIMEYFKEHESPNLLEIADAFQLSKDYFGKLFKRQMDVTFNQFLLKYKMEYAKKLLCHSDYKIYEIGDKLGYRTTDYFSKIFKDYAGETPIQFRKRHLGGEEKEW